MEAPAPVPLRADLASAQPEPPAHTTSASEPLRTRSRCSGSAPRTTVAAHAPAAALPRSGAVAHCTKARRRAGSGRSSADAGTARQRSPKYRGRKPIGGHSRGAADPTRSQSAERDSGPPCNRRIANRPAAHAGAGTPLAARARAEREGALWGGLARRTGGGGGAGVPCVDTPRAAGGGEGLGSTGGGGSRHGRAGHTRLGAVVGKLVAAFSAIIAAAIHTSLPIPAMTLATCSSAKFRGSSAADTPVGIGARHAGQPFGAAVTGTGKPPLPRSSQIHAWQKL